jgi:hypothetical protein
MSMAVHGWAQGQGNTGGTGGTGGTGSTGGMGETPTFGGGTNTGGQNQGGNVSGFGDPFELGNLLQIGQDFTRDSMYENNRVQPFVGPSTENVLHPRSQIDPAGSTLGSSSSRGGITFGTSAQNRARGGLGTTGFGSTGTGSQQGFSVDRRGVRSSLAYTSAGTVADEVTSAQFASRMNRLPLFANVNGVEVHVQNRIATLRGVVPSEQQKEMLGRQAELEPGIDYVVNDLVVQQ